MSATRISLQQVRVAEPCTVPWDTMRGDDRRRFCDHCNRHVHNLSAMPEDEAQRLVCDSAGRLCIAYVPNQQGGVTQLQYAEQKRPRYGWRFVAMIAALCGSASAVTTAIYRPKPAAAVPLIGGQMLIAGTMAPPPPATQPAPPAMILGEVFIPSEPAPAAPAPGGEGH